MFGIVDDECNTLPWVVVTLGSVKLEIAAAPVKDG
jgi:hypothetical protein